MPTFAQFTAPWGSIVWALVGGLELFQSTDRGDTWQQRPLPSSPGVEWISFVDDHQGWVMLLGSPATQCLVQLVWLWHTVDAGASWQRLNATGIRDAQCKSSVSFVDPHARVPGRLYRSNHSSGAFTPQGGYGHA